MLTQTEIAALPDAELVRLVAERVMGWGNAKLTDDKLHPIRDRDTFAVSEGGHCFVFDGIWSPLTDENHTRQVRVAMQAKGWRFTMAYHGLNGDSYAVTVQFYLQDSKRPPVERTAVCNEQRAILEAALTAVQGPLSQEEIKALAIGKIPWRTDGR